MYLINEVKMVTGRRDERRECGNSQDSLVFNEVYIIVEKGLCAQERYCDITQMLLLKQGTQKTFSSQKVQDQQIACFGRAEAQQSHSVCSTQHLGIQLILGLLYRSSSIS